MYQCRLFKYRLNKKQWRLFFVIFLLFTTPAGEFVYAEQTNAAKNIKEIAPGLLEGYFSPEMLPDSLKLLPPSPADDSKAFALDRAVSEDGIKLKKSSRWKQAIKDANLRFPEAIEGFVDVVNILITEEKTPHLYMLLRRTLTDLGLSTYATKTEYNRRRPFMINNEPVCTSDDEEKLRKDGSYPSGHTAIEWGWVLLLCELFPEQLILASQKAFECTSKGGCLEVALDDLNLPSF